LPPDYPAKVLAMVPFLSIFLTIFLIALPFMIAFSLFVEAP